MGKFGTAVKLRKLVNTSFVRFEKLSMSLKRRQFLILSGMLVSFGLAILLHKTFVEAKASKHSSTSTSDSTALNSAKQSSDSIAGANKAPAPEGLFAPTRGEVRLVVISDMNSQYGSTSYEPEVTRAIALIPDWQPDLVLGGGDMVAGQYPSLTRGQIQAMWAAFDRQVGAPLRRANLPFGFTIGNHDASAALAVSGKYLFSNERELAAAHWNNPQHDPGLQFVDRAKFPFYYTFQKNDIFYLVWDASTDKIPFEQLAWVKRSLASPTAQAAKMRIVIGHLPLYAVAVGRDEPGEILDNADQLRSLLESYHVHTYVSGHHHAYFPGHRGQLELLYTGALGSGPRPLLNSALAPRKTLTVVDVNLASASTTYTTYDMTTLKLVDHRKLPRIIVGPNGMVLRRDVQWNDLTPEEKSLSHTPSN